MHPAVIGIEDVAAPFPARAILGVAVRDMSESDALGVLLGAFEGGRHVKLAFCNAHFSNIAQTDRAFRAALSEFLVLPDGIGVDIAARLLHGRAFAANLNGTDFIPRLIRASHRPLRIALIGGRPGVAERAAAALFAMDDRHQFALVRDGFMGPAGDEAFVAELAGSPVDLVLVAMGNPLQEKWIADNLSARHCRVAAGVGALFDFLAGDVRRAPDAVRRVRLEWAWRLMLEPRRLFARYVLGNPLFLMRVGLARLGLARS